MVIALFISHLVGDYVLQWDSLARWKSRELKGVLVHGMIVLLVTWLCSLPFNPAWWQWVLFIGLTHTAVDAIRLRLGNHFAALALFLLDQAVHLSIILLALMLSGYVTPSSLMADLAPMLREHRLLTVALGYVFVTMPAWILVEFIVYGLMKGSAPDFSQVPNKYVSSLERGLITTSVLLGQFMLVPLVALPRLVFEKARVADSQRARLYLMELLASIALAVAVGLGLRQI